MRYLVWEIGWVEMPINEQSTREDDRWLGGGVGWGRRWKVMGLVWDMLDFRYSWETEKDIQRRELVYLVASGVTLEPGLCGS